MPPHPRRRRLMLLRPFLQWTVLGAVILAAPHEAGAACNLIPSASQRFRSDLGATNRPFAAPGDFVEVGVQPGRCDTASPGFSPTAGDHVVTLIFTPPGGQARVVFLGTDDCATNAATSRRKA